MRLFLWGLWVTRVLEPASDALTLTNADLAGLGSCTLFLSGLRALVLVLVPAPDALTPPL